MVFNTPLIYNISYHVCTSKLGFLVFDDGCHLKKFATNSVRSASTTTASKIAGMHIVIDKMHFRGHADQWCKRYCNPHDYEELEKVYLHLHVDLYALAHAELLAEKMNINMFRGI